MKRAASKSKNTKPNPQTQLHANRANAKKSTGPKTPEGKRRSSRNAIKHGLLSSHVVIAAGDECPDQFPALLADPHRMSMHPYPATIGPKTTCFFCKTKPKNSTGAIKNAVRAQKTNPIEPISKQAVGLGADRSMTRLSRF